MATQKSQYENCLAEYSSNVGAIALLKQHRPYWEMIPSLRRPEESIITIPLPIIRRLKVISSNTTSNETNLLPCDIAILMCDPEWKIKTGGEIFIFIHRPEEDFSDLLSRWRQIQVWLDKDYEWLMPSKYSHILSEGASQIYPLFIVFPETPERIKRGLAANSLPFAIQTPELDMQKITEEIFPQSHIT
jgi:hypothetical protein